MKERPPGGLCSVCSTECIIGLCHDAAVALLCVGFVLRKKARDMGWVPRRESSVTRDWFGETCGPSARGKGSAERSELWTRFSCRQGLPPWKSARLGARACGTGSVRRPAWLWNYCARFSASALDWRWAAEAIQAMNQWRVQRSAVLVGLRSERDDTVRAWPQRPEPVEGFARD